MLGQHPIIDRTREYFAFQFDLPGASIDNIRVWKATGQRGDWAETRKRLAGVQAERDPVDRDPAERYKIEYTNVKSRLTLHDPAYRDLVARHDKLQVALHADYPEAFATHKELNKLIAKRKQHIKQTDADFKRMEIAVHKASQCEDAYILSTRPELVKLKEDGSPKQRFQSELGQARAHLEATGDQKLAALVDETEKRRAALEARFPEAFASVETAVENRQAKRKALNANSDFQDRNRAVVEAGKAIKEYEQQTAPHLAELEAASKAFVDSHKASE